MRELIGGPGAASTPDPWPSRSAVRPHATSPRTMLCYATIMFPGVVGIEGATGSSKTTPNARGGAASTSGQAQRKLR